MENESELDLIFFALSDSKRRLIITELSEESKSVGELAECFSLTVGAVSKNISILQNAGLIYKTRHGKQIYCHMNFDIWRKVAKFIAMHTRFWERRLDELADYIDAAEQGGRRG